MNDPIPLSPLPRKPARVHTHSLRVILAVLRHFTDRDLPAEVVLAVLAEEVARLGRQNRVPRGGLVLRAGEIQALLEDYRHQSLIDRIAAWGTRTFGPESTYAEAYPQYLVEARAQGLTPYSLKSFKNRAFKDPLQRKAEALEAATRHRRKHAA